MGETSGWRTVAGLTVKRLTRAARAHVPKPTRRTACLHVSRAMQAARRHADFDFTRRLGRRAEAGPRRGSTSSWTEPGLARMGFVTVLIEAELYALCGDQAQH